MNVSKATLYELYKFMESKLHKMHNYADLNCHYNDSVIMIPR